MLSPFHCKPQFLFLESVELCYFIPDCKRTLYRKKPVGRGIIPGADIGTDKSVGRGKQFRCLQHGHLASRNAPLVFVGTINDDDCDLQGPSSVAGWLATVSGRSAAS